MKRKNRFHRRRHISSGTSILIYISNFLSFFSLLCILLVIISTWKQNSPYMTLSHCYDALIEQSRSIIQNLGIHKEGTMKGILPAPLRYDTLIGNIAWFGAILGVLFGYLRWHAASILKKAELLKQYVTHMFSVPEIISTIYTVECDPERDIELYHKNTREARNFDRTLTFFSYVCYLISRKILNKREIPFFEYHVDCLLNSRSVQKYLLQLHEAAEEKNVTMPFNHLCLYALKHHYFSLDDLDALEAAPPAPRTVGATIVLKSPMRGADYEISAYNDVTTHHQQKPAECDVDTAATNDDPHTDDVENSSCDNDENQPSF